MAEAQVYGRAENEACCADGPAVSRRQFVRTVGTGILAASAPILGRPAFAEGPAKVGPSPSAPAETAVAPVLQDHHARAAQDHLLPVRPSQAVDGQQQLGDRQADDRRR